MKDIKEQANNTFIVKKSTKCSNNLLLFLLVLPLYLWNTNLYAVLEVVVLKSSNELIPITILPFENNNNLTDVAKIIKNNLTISGYFTINNKSLLSSKDKVNNVNFKKWRDNKTDFLVLGGVEDSGVNFVKIYFYLYNIYSGDAVIAYKYKTKKDAIGRIAHKISDKIYQAILGKKGSFDTYIAYVVVTRNKVNNKNKYSIEISDSDGNNPQVLISSDEPLTSPVWSPDNKKIAFVSFENGSSEIFIKYPFVRRKTQKLPKFDGIANAPSWHPSGKKLAITLSKNGNNDIYIYDLATKDLTRITKHKAIDTEANFSPDGKKFVFTSNRSGNPNIYMFNLITNKIKRITYNGNYNVSASFSPDGKYLVMLNLSNNNYHIALLNLKSNEWTLMTKNNLDESPYFSPNSNMIIYSTNEGNKGVLSVLSIDGLNSHQLKSRIGEVRDANWSNYLEK